MNKLFLGVFVLVLTQSLFGQPAIYQDNLLTIPQGAIIDADNPAYYKNIILSNDGNGNFTLIAAQNRNLVVVDSVDVLILESFPVQVWVAISGSKSVPCVELETPAVSRKGSLFTVVLAETQLAPVEFCIDIIGQFETSVALDVLGLEAGTYMVRVNGMEAEFTLDIDN